MTSRSQTHESAGSKQQRPFRRRPVLLYVTITAMLAWIGFLIAMIWF